MNFKFRNLKRKFSLMLYRIEKSNSHFFDDVRVEDKKIMDNIIEWMFMLKYYKDISIDKFTNLFNNFEGIIFPIIIYGHPRHLQIKDNAGNHYYLWYNAFDFKNREDYTIGVRTKHLDTEFTYRLNKNKEIVLKELWISQLDDDSNNTNNRIRFCYFDYNSEDQITTAFLQTETSKLEIHYPSVDSSQDEQIASHLFDLANKFTYIDDVSCVLVHISDILKKSNQNYSLTMTSYQTINKEEIILSEVCLSYGVITKYSFTTRTSDLQHSINTQYLSEELESFISKH